jgi:hypothetical protein
MRSFQHMAGTAALMLALLAPGFAYQKGKPAQKPAPPPSPRSNFQPGRGGSFGAPQGDDRHPVHKAGSWLRKYNNMSSEEQQRALDNDPKFQELPPERQQKLRERLRRFNALSPEDRERMIDRMGHWEDMSPEQRERWKQFQGRIGSMPEERRRPIRQMFRSLRKLSPEERQRTFASDRFNQDFSAEEKALLQSMLEAADADARNEANPQPRDDRF